MDDGNGNEIYNIGDDKMPGGDNINNIKSMFSREKQYVDALIKVREQLKSIQDYKVGHVCPGIQGLINYISDVLGE